MNEIPPEALPPQALPQPEAPLPVTKAPPKKLKLPDEEIQRLLLEIVEHFDDEDRDVRERQIRKCKRLKLFWDSIFQAWYSEVAHDWRIWDPAGEDGSNSDQSYYDKPVNTFRAYIETIIAALSVTTPSAKCFPADAESSLDTVTAKAGDKISKLIDNHNNAPLLWLKALYIYYTEGTVFGYSYPREDEKYGTYETDKYETQVNKEDVVVCATCKKEVEVDEITNTFQPENQGQEICQGCGNPLQMEPGTKVVTTEKLVGKDLNSKTRCIIEVFGGLRVKIANYATKAEQTPYLIYSYEVHSAQAMEEYDHLLGNAKLKEKLKNQGTGPADPYAQWGRMSTLYMGEYPTYVVTMRKAWLRPSAYNVLGDVKDIQKLRKLYPRGVKVCLVNDEFGSAESEALDDYWSISVNPHEDYLNHDPAGIPLVTTQEITNDIISLVLQTIEHGIGQTFADPGVLNFKAYKETETTPGGVYEATPKSGKGVGDGFFQLKTATLSAEVMPFFEMVQGLAQLVSGALPSLFGGQLDGSNTASEYSMSQAQARQRIQNVYKLFTSWWKEVKGKAIPIYINNMKTDEQDVEKLPDGTFVNLMIRLSELHGRIGKIELEAADNLPMTWTQTRDTVMKMIEAQNPTFLEMIADPANIPVLRDTIGLNDFHIPGEDDRLLQMDEIRDLLASEPIPSEDPNNPEAPLFMPSVEIDVTFNKHNIHFEVVRQWATGEAGKLAKIENEAGYQNVLLHGQMHFFEMNKQMVLAQAQQAAPGAGAGADNPEKPKGSKEVKGEADVPVKQ